MTVRISRRTNEAWVAALRDEGARSAEAVRELAAYLRRMIDKGVQGRLDEADLSDVVHESIRSIIQALPAFRGDSRFTTWAAGIALRVAFTELRRRHARARAMGAFEAVEAEVRRISAARAPPPDEALARTATLQALEHAIATTLTERQRVAIVAELRGIPLVEIARRLETNVNALYKLTHDARRRLRRALADAGLTEGWSDPPPLETKSCR